MTQPRGWRFVLSRTFRSTACVYLRRTILYLALGWTLTGQWIRAQLDGEEQDEE